MYHSKFTLSRRAFFLLTFVITFCLTAPATLAVYPEEADPDPDLTNQAPLSSSPQVLVLNNFSELDVTNLEPGRYMIWIVDEDGRTQAMYEVVVQG